MKNNLACWEIIGFIFVVILGSLLHFVYQWSGSKRVVGLFAPVNESTWEHLKLLFIPMLLYSIVEYFAVGKHYPNFIVAKALGIVFGMIAIVAIFYTYTGIVGKHFLWADILTFVLGVAVAYLYSWEIINKQPISLNSQITGIILVLVLTFCFAIFTFSPPQIQLFLDPVNKGYGISTKSLDHQ